ncbi:MAG: hypothetical protein PHE50_06830 [Dehalococcoidales bacterium]|nr:hypothetical protein [Dehalococcoidales bacterium]
MEIDDARIKEAVARTEILRTPKSNLLTFGTTNIYYYLVTEPIYANPDVNTNETVVREGRVLAEKPRIVTPYYLNNLDGFSANARRYFDYLTEVYGKNSPALLYAYKNEPKELNIVSNSLPLTVEKLNADIDRRGDPLTAIIKGVDELWDVALIKFIFEMTSRSVQENVSQLHARGLFEIDTKGIPSDVRYRITEMFRLVQNGALDPRELKSELDRWDLFPEYEDRFLSLFRK